MSQISWIIKVNDNFMIYVSMNIKDNQLQQKDSSMLFDQCIDEERKSLMGNRSLNNGDFRCNVPWYELKN